MSAINDLRLALTASTSAPWQSANTLPSGAIEIGNYKKDADAALALSSRNSLVQVIALYDAVKAYQVRMNQGRAPLTVQRTAINNALKALEV